VTVYHFTGS
ncbi:bacterial NAD-glutamate dehydrogenase family protein, partial [Vibrio harveyi]